MELKELMIGDWQYQYMSVLSDDETERVNRRSKMIAKEQMVGDWVYSPTGRLYKLRKSDFVNDDAWFEDCSPIQLTPEILELNGFVHDNNEKCWKLVKNDGRYALYSIYVNSNRISIYNWRNEEGECFTDACNKVNVHYKYVHELQHALRLCGLTELADNFKVK